MGAQLTYRGSGQFLTLKIHYIKPIKPHLTHTHSHTVAAADITAIDLLNKFRPIHQQCLLLWLL